MTFTGACEVLVLLHIRCKEEKKLNKDKIELIDQIACDRNNVYGSDYFIPLSLLLTILQYPYTAGKEMSLIRLHIVHVETVA
jgi:hypothetical protein